jgi:uncharacterized membrane protein YhaH (DUF805 family)
MFKKPFSFNGRIRRKEFGLSYLIYIIFIIFFSIVIQENSNLSILGLAILPLFWFLIAQGTKRCHDLGHRGWYMIIPFYGLWMLFSDGRIGNNEYGPNPKGIGNEDDSEDLGKHLIE